MCIIILFTAGFPVFTKGNWSASGFVSSYLYVSFIPPFHVVHVRINYQSHINRTLTFLSSDIGLVTAAYLFWKFFKKTSIVALKDIPLREAIERARGDPGVIENVPRWRKIAGFLWD